MTSEIHVRFSRACDAPDAFPTIDRCVGHAVLRRSRIDVACDPAEQESTISAVAHAVDEWCVQHELPFTPLRLDQHTLLVCPPGD